MTTKKELLVVVYVFEKFWPYILRSKIIIYIDHVELKYWLSKKEAKHDSYYGCYFFKSWTWRLKISRVERTRSWITYHVFHSPSMGHINDLFPNKHLFAISNRALWFAHIVNFLMTGSIPKHWSRHWKNKFFHELKYYFFKESLLFLLIYNQIIQWYVPKEE